MRNITINGYGPELTLRFYPPIYCGNDSHELALFDLQTVNTIINVPEGCNTMIYIDDEETRYTLTIPEGTYNVDAIHDRIYDIMSHQFPKEFKMGRHYFDLKADTSTHRCSISTSFKIIFGKEDVVEGPTLGTLLGFAHSPIAKTAKNKYKEAEGTFSLIDDFNVFVTCNVVDSGYINNRVSHNLYRFHVDVQPGVVIRERPSHPVFYRVTHGYIDDLTLRLENELGNLIALKENTKVRISLELRERRDGNA